MIRDSHIEGWHELIKSLVASKGRASSAIAYAQTHDFEVRTVQVLKAMALGFTVKTAVNAASTSDATWAGPLVDYRTLQSAFFASLRSVSLFDSILPLIGRVPPNTKFALTTLAASGSNVAELVWKPITKMGFDGDQLAPRKALAIVVLSDELARFRSASAESLVNLELRAAVAAASDVPTVTALLAGLTPTASSGDARTDIRTLLAAVPLKQGSRPVLATSPAVVAQMAMLGVTDGAPAFPDLAIPSGGSISGVPVFGVDALADYAGGLGDLLVLMDASQLAGDSGDIALVVSNAASLAMSDGPANAAQNVTSLFQTDSVAIKAEREFAFDRVRDSAVAVIKNVIYAPGA